MKNKKSETITITVSEYRTLQHQAAMLYSILSAPPTERSIIADAIVRTLTKQKGEPK